MKSMKKTLVSKVFVSVCFAGLISLSSTSAHADAASSLKNQMYSQFGIMSNSTDPSSFSTSRRGVISGGSFIARTKVMNANIVSFVPPSIQAGCGGIDMYGGSLSFINKDQFVQLLRSVASNAAGYAFYIAMEALAPSIRQTMAQLQEALQKLNQFMGNSCQLAQGIVNDTLRSHIDSERVKAGMKISVTEGFGDVYEAFTTVTGESSKEAVDNFASKEDFVGNTIYRVLKDHGVSSWYASGDQGLLIAIMSVVGTIVVGPELAESPDGQGKDYPIVKMPGVPRPVQLLAQGGEVQLLSCNGSSNCSEVTKDGGTTKIEGFRSFIEDNLLGTQGVIKKIYSKESLTETQKAFMESLPQGLSGQIFRLARATSYHATEAFVKDNIEMITITMSYELVASFYDSVEQSLNALSVADKVPMQDQVEGFLAESRDRMQDDMDLLVAEKAPLSNMLNQYLDKLRVAKEKGLTIDLEHFK